AENLKNINIGLRSQGYDTPLVADVHFNPKVADVAAQYAEKVRINPGNYVDPGRTFRKLEYTDEEYAQEIEKIRARFIPFLNICKENHTAIRIGVNHGSLSDRIMSHYGDTPEGMVESCMEFLRICVAEHFNDVVISIKASNTVVMVRTVRLLVKEMEKEGMAFPLHLGVTEAAPQFNYLSPGRRKTKAVRNIGGDNLPVVIAERLEGSFETNPQFKPDYIYCGGSVPQSRDNNIAYLVDANAWNPEEKNVYPAFNYQQMIELHHTVSDLKFLFLPYMAMNDEVIAALKLHPEVVIIAQSNHPNRLGEYRAMTHELMNERLENPVVFFQYYQETKAEDLQMKAAADMGAL
ncbi:4-hydroxy-3-methylbut-2-en-1-yl diphosphate synthase, partial [Bacteroides ovatus]